MIYYLQSQSILNPLREQRLLASIRGTLPKSQRIRASEQYFVCAKNSLSKGTIEEIAKLLRAIPMEPRQLAPQELLVVPRFGTITPWSSKATDIFHNAGLREMERIERGWLFTLDTGDEKCSMEPVKSYFYDSLTECVIHHLNEAKHLFLPSSPPPFDSVEMLRQGRSALTQANQRLGMALNEEEIDYLFDVFKNEQRDPSHAELMMFAQLNSEHCRHKIFNAKWSIDGEEQPNSLFSMIKNTHRQHSDGVLQAYSDNAAVIEGVETDQWWPNPENQQYHYQKEPTHTVFKAETHNHPTAICPLPGAATGSGGEIRDEVATGRGAKPTAGWVGFAVGNLHIPNYPLPFETPLEKPPHLASALDIMIQAPVGAARFNNEFGRPCIAGFFRTYAESTKEPHQYRGYYKPIMLAGGIGRIRQHHLYKQNLPVEVPIIVLGGPAMAIGIGGGGASSLSSGENKRHLDFASVQRSNPEMQRRCQAVLEHCIALGKTNPILSIHDVGAGGLANALPELVAQSGMGGKFELRSIPCADNTLSPFAIWCNESQERYVLAIHQENLPLLKALAERERCPLAVVGHTTPDKRIVLNDEEYKNTPVNLSTEALFDLPPKMHRNLKRIKPVHSPLNKTELSLEEVAKRVLELPSVASKAFLITIADRTVGGLTHRDQMVGPWQVPVADCGVTLAGFQTQCGQAIALGERPLLSLINPQASARMAIAEAITNIASAPISELKNIVLSANWMAACGEVEDDLALFDAVKTVGMELCPALGLCVPVGKDSLSMHTVWQEKTVKHEMRAPLSLVISAVAPVYDVVHSLTPQLLPEYDSELWLIQLSEHQRLGASAFAQLSNQLGNEVPDLDDPSTLKNFFHLMQTLIKNRHCLAYHDRSEGGLWTTVCEMAFAGRLGVTLDITACGSDPLAILLNEELGAVVQISATHRDAFLACLSEGSLKAHSHCIGRLNKTDEIIVTHEESVVLQAPRNEWQRRWYGTSYHMQAVRDHPDCAQEAKTQELTKHPGLMGTEITFNLDEVIASPFINKNKPKVAILREQGVNGHAEMAAAFHEANFTAVDVHMSDIIHGRISLKEFHGLVACGGFSYGDVLGAGRGWAMSILHDPKVLQEFTEFFNRKETFTLGVCNGCQMLSHLSALIPGSDHFPRFKSNRSDQFEARLVLTEILPSPSLFFEGMQGSRLPVVVSHAEGRTTWQQNKVETTASTCIEQKLATLRYVNPHGKPTEIYPNNPNGSALGLTGFTSQDGRVTLMMPHPERVFKTTQFSWCPKTWRQSPWARLFGNARRWVG